MQEVQKCCFRCRKGNSAMKCEPLIVLEETRRRRFIFFAKSDQDSQNGINIYRLLGNFRNKVSKEIDRVITKNIRFNCFDASFKSSVGKNIFKLGATSFDLLFFAPFFSGAKAMLVYTHVLNFVKRGKVHFQ